MLNWGISWRSGNTEPQGRQEFSLIPPLPPFLSKPRWWSSQSPVWGTGWVSPWKVCPWPGAELFPAPHAAGYGSAFHGATGCSHHSSDSSGAVSSLLDSPPVTADRKKSPVIQKWIPAGPPGNSSTLRQAWRAIIPSLIPQKHPWEWQAGFLHTSAPCPGASSLPARSRRGWNPGFSESLVPGQRAHEE